MKIITDKPEELWKLYAEGREYKSRLNLFRTVTINERFYAGDQWHGLEAPDIDKPVVNIIRQKINYMAATITRDDVAIDLSPSLPSQEEERYLNCVQNELKRCREQNDMQSLNRDAVRDAGVDGDVCLYHYWDETVKTGQNIDGDVRMHLIENTRCIFGNPTCRDVQRQPYVQIIMRDFVEDVIDEAVAEGMPEDEARDLIRPDADYDETEQMFDKLVTKVMTFYRKEGTVHCVISTAKAIIRDEWDTGLYLYPLAWFSWQRSRNSYHGVSIVTELVPTQIYVNKMVANYLRCTSMYAWPKIIFNGAKIEKWDSRIGQNIKVMGSPQDAYAAIFPGTGASADVASVLDWIIARTNEASGANDAAMGRVDSDNTSAIIAAQQANTIPLDLVQRAFYAFQEQSIRITLDMLRARAGTRFVEYNEEDYAAAQQPLIPGAGGEQGMLPKQLVDPALDSGSVPDGALPPAGTRQIDFAHLGDIAWQLDVSVGAGSWFSEAIRNQTLSNHVQNGLITRLEYFERVSDDVIPNKQGIIDRIKEEMAAAQQQPTDLNDTPPTTGGTATNLAAQTGTPDIGEPGPVGQAKRYIAKVEQAV